MSTSLAQSDKMKRTMSRGLSRVFVAVLATVLCVCIWTAGILGWFLLQRDPLHVPQLEQEPNGALGALVSRDKPSSAFGYYGVLSAADDADLWGLRLPDRATLRIHLLVPDNEVAGIRQPSLAVVGPGLGAAGADLPFSVPAGNGMLLAEPRRDARPFANAVVPGGWSEVGELTFQAPSEGTYALAVYDPLRETGPYAVIAEGPEPRSASDLALLAWNGSRGLWHLLTNE